jgi:AcrR family transcriptional regulator
MTADQLASSQLGKRDRKKAEKLTSIKKAARKLFRTKGYHALTMREVARVAEVGFGTVSAYAIDKAGLLAMLFVEDLEHFPPVFEKVDPKLPLIEQLMGAFALMFSFWARHPDLSRAVLPQLQSKNTSPHIAAILKRRAAVRAELVAWIDSSKSKKLIAGEVNSEQAAEMLFALYTSTMHEWLMSETIEIEMGLARLRYLFELPVAGMRYRRRSR